MTRSPQAVHVIVEHRLTKPFDETGHCAGRPGQAARCLELYGIRHVGSFIARDRNRMLCHFTAPDVESVRQAVRATGYAAEAIWSCDYRASI